MQFYLVGFVMHKEEYARKAGAELARVYGHAIGVLDVQVANLNDPGTVYPVEFFARAETPSVDPDFDEYSEQDYRA